MAINVERSIYSDVADFLISQPTLDAIAAYRVSSGVQQHIDDLLEKNRETGLSAEERLELDKILAVTHLMDMVKAKAQVTVSARKL